MKDKVLVVAANNLGIGGIQNVIMSIVRNLSDEYQFDIVCFDSQKQTFDDEFLSYGGQIFRIPFYEGNSRLRRKADYYIRGYYIKSEVKKILCQNVYKIIHCHNMSESWLCLSAAKDCGVPIRISHAHTAFTFEGNPISYRFVRWREELIKEYATNLVACSRKSGKNLFHTDNFQVIFNSVDIEKFKKKSKNTIRKSQGITLIQVALYCDNKNQLFSLNVLLELRKYSPDSNIIFVGRAPNAETKDYLLKMKNFISNHGLESNVRFFAADSDIPALLSAADYLLFPSKAEGFSIVPLEAQAVGLKCFVSDAVIREVNCGCCEYISLSKKPSFWAEAIFSSYQYDKGKIYDADMSAFSPFVIMEQYRRLYWLDGVS